MKLGISNSLHDELFDYDDVVQVANKNGVPLVNGWDDSLTDHEPETLSKFIDDLRELGDTQHTLYANGQSHDIDTLDDPNEEITDFVLELTGLTETHDMLEDKQPSTITELKTLLPDCEVEKVYYMGCLQGVKVHINGETLPVLGIYSVLKD